jgi:hypothetical protein
MRTYRQDEANSLLSQFCHRALKKSYPPPGKDPSHTVCPWYKLNCMKLVQSNSRYTIYLNATKNVTTLRERVLWTVFRSSTCSYVP